MAAMAPERKSLAMQIDGPPKGSGRLKRTCIEVVKISPKRCYFSEDLAQDKSKWRNKIHVADDDDDDDVYLKDNTNFFF